MRNNELFSPLYEKSDTYMMVSRMKCDVRRKHSINSNFTKEFIRTPQLAPIELPVSSFVNELSKRVPEADVVACSDPTESAADKLSAITWRIPDRIRGEAYDDPSIVRHIHDLAILSNTKSRK